MRVSNVHRIVIDSNVRISFLTGKTLNGFQCFLNNNTIRIITCRERIVELSETLHRPKFQKYFSRCQINEFFDLLDEKSEIVSINLDITLFTIKKSILKTIIQSEMRLIKYIHKFLL
ncbi:MAG: putative toxin-antitoxin system toxin component, PIN family [Dysgonamonadaceae bacterium]|nr:putative toxin-antitoxin system toxin component, PIN family [Dysgonamonadaceae bacterium]